MRGGSVVVGSSSAVVHTPHNNKANNSHVPDRSDSRARELDSDLRVTTKFH